MPTELLRVDQNITWLQTIIRPSDSGIETDFHFSTEDGTLSVAIDMLPDSGFLSEVMQTDCLAIREHSAEERGWTENDRFEIRINDNDDVAFATIRGSHVRWGPM